MGSKDASQKMNRRPNLHSFVYAAPTVIRPQRLIGIARTAAIMLLLAALPGLQGQEIRLASDAPSALPPKESRQLFRLPADRPFIKAGNSRRSFTETTSAWTMP